MKKYPSRVSTIFVALFLLTVGIVIFGIFSPSSLPDAVGIIEKSSQTTNQTTGRTVTIAKRTLWDLGNLLLVPIVISVGGFLLNQAQQKREQEFAESQNENQRRIGLDRDQEQTLQNYLDKMGELLLERKLSTTKNKVVLNLARSRTLTVLRSLNNPYLDIKEAGENRRKGSLARFLYEMNLINGKKPIISLRKANLSYAYMHSGELAGANFEGTYLSEADLRNADLRDAYLTDCYLRGARLNDAHLEGANLTKADLKRANLEGAHLDGAILDNAELQGAIMPDGSVHA
jgi:uncharacterized protein YjbI with pentapeptide repeats